MHRPTPPEGAARPHVAPSQQQPTLATTTSASRYRSRHRSRRTHPVLRQKVLHTSDFTLQVALTTF